MIMNHDPRKSNLLSSEKLKKQDPS